MPLTATPAPAAEAGTPQDPQAQIALLQAQLAVAQQEAIYWHDQFEALLLACLDKTDQAVIDRLQTQPAAVLQ